MKIVSLHLELENTNYHNCLKKGLLLLSKEEADVLAFHRVKAGFYGLIKDYPHLSEFKTEISKTSPFGEVLLVRSNFRDVEYDEKSETTAYVYKRKVIAISRKPRSDDTDEFLKGFCYPNGNMRSTILIDPTDMYLMDSIGTEKVDTQKKPMPEVGKYPAQIANVKLSDEE